IDHVRVNIKDRTKFTSVGMEDICSELGLPPESDGRMIHSTIKQLDRGQAFQQWNVLNMKLKALREKLAKLQAKLHSKREATQKYRTSQPYCTTAQYIAESGQGSTSAPAHMRNTPTTPTSTSGCRRSPAPVSTAETGDKGERYTGRTTKTPTTPQYTEADVGGAGGQLERQLAHITRAIDTVARSTARAKRQRDQCEVYGKHEKVLSMWQAVNGRYQNGERYKFRGELFEQEAHQEASRYLLAILRARDGRVFKVPRDTSEYTIITNQVWSRRKPPVPYSRAEVHSADEEQVLCTTHTSPETQTVTGKKVPYMSDTEVSTGAREYRGLYRTSYHSKSRLGGQPGEHLRTAGIEGLQNTTTLSPVDTDAYTRHNEQLLRHEKGSGEADIVALDAHGLVVGIVEVKSGCLAIADAYHQQTRHMNVHPHTRMHTLPADGFTSVKTMGSYDCGRARRSSAKSKEIKACTHGRRNKGSPGARAPHQYVHTAQQDGCATQADECGCGDTGGCYGNATLGGRRLHPSGVVVLVATLLPPNRYVIGCPPSVLHAYTRALTKYDLWHCTRLSDTEVRLAMDYVYSSLKQPLSPLQWLDRFGQEHLLIL
ncbi:hypothetical protein SARC_11537, partial [Sphaeroforma arctica JP610]